MPPHPASIKTSSTATFEERRRTIRRPNVCEAWVRSPTDTDDTKVEVTGLDLSRHGVGFETHHPMVEGCFYWIELGIGDKQIASEIRVMSCVASDDVPGTWRVGAKFC